MTRPLAGQLASQGSGGSAERAAGRPLRVLACGSTLEGGGSERQLWQLVSQLDRDRFAPEVFLLARRGVYLSQLPSDVPVHAFSDFYPNPRTFPPGRISRLQAAHLRQLVHSRSIDVLYDRTFHSSLLTGAACPHNPPRVSVIVSPPSRDVLQTERRWVWLKRRLLARAYRTAAATICVSQEVAEDASAFYALPRAHFRVMPNPIDIARVRRQSQEPLASSQASGLAELAQPSGDALHIAVIGRFTAEKGQRLAIETLAELSARPGQLDPKCRTHLHLVGAGPLEAELVELVRKLDLTETVHFHGFMTNPYPLLAHCQLAFVPSRYEGFPNAALESLALGVPLLMTDYGPTAREIVGSQGERGQVVTSGDCRAAAAAVLDRWQHPERWQARAAAGRQWVEREHSFDRWLDQMSSLLEQVHRDARSGQRA
ncbi:MAG: glycosyltransferase [Aureliella sp.]